MTLIDTVPNWLTDDGRWHEQQGKTRKYLLSRGLSEARVEEILVARSRHRSRARIMFAETQAARAQHRQFFDEVMSQMQRYDVGGLMNYPGSETTYYDETSFLVLRISEIEKYEDIQRILHEVFGYWFGPLPHITAANYDGMARDIWEAWQRYQETERAE